ncbi:hypothetical protein ACH5RR_024840 [Cinchona calisaya]|uniref:Sey1/RHD3-like three-helix bundle domain-containing protein n=1 Tax=Cinchona calisaya TaxID=153742 RepID=A0ABD2YZ05_9GENT
MAMKRMKIADLEIIAALKESAAIELKRPITSTAALLNNDTEAPSKRRNIATINITAAARNQRKTRRGTEAYLRLQLLVQVSGSILGIDYNVEDEDGGEARKKKEVGSDVEFREIDARGFGVLLFLTWKRRYSDTMDCCTSDARRLSNFAQQMQKQNPIEMDVSNWPRYDSLASSDLFVIMCLDDFDREPCEKWQLSSALYPSPANRLSIVYGFMSGKNVFRNVMGTVFPGVNSIIAERTNQIYGQLLERFNCFRLLAPAISDVAYLFISDCGDVLIVEVNHFTLVYDMRFELDEIEARRDQYPYSISFVSLLNTLIADEMDVNNRGVCSLASSGLYVIMRLDHFRNEPIQILAINGSWLLPVFSTSRCAFAEQPVYCKHFTLSDGGRGFGVAEDKFWKYGKPFRIIGGDLHYFRVLPQTSDGTGWDKLCGANTGVDESQTPSLILHLMTMDDTAFKNQSARFGLAVSEIVLINMWCHDTGHEQTAKKPLLKKTVFQTPLENLEPVLQEDIQKIWDSVPKPQAHKETPSSGFLICAVVPASGFSFSGQQIWKIIKDNKDLDLPDKVMVATVCCEEIANEECGSFLENEEWRVLQEIQYQIWREEFSSILDTYLLEYRAEATCFDKGVNTGKRKQLEVKLLQISGCMLDANHNSADAIFDQANWDSSKVRDKLRHVIDAHVATVRTAKLSELTSTFETKLNEALSVLPVEALLKGATDDTWPGIRELLQRETETAVFGFSSALSSFEMDEEIKEKGKIMLEGWLSRRQKKKQGGL